MTTWLIQISFGPVQGFIAAARRTRDLWGGSLILSGIAHAGGRSLINSGAELIYPLQSRVEENVQTSNLSNVLLARINNASEEKAKGAALAALQAGQERLRKYSEEAKSKLKEGLHSLRLDLWDDQVNDVLETFAAWVEMPDDSAYETAIGKLKSAMAARKNTREFTQMNVVDGFPKSSLDGLRESVLPKKIAPRIRRQLGLSEGEQLDALGIIKRHVGNEKRFTPLTRLAVDSWIRQLDPANRQQLCVLYEPLVGFDLATRVTGNNDTYSDFPYDASLLFPERLQKELHILKNDNDQDDEDKEALISHLKNLQAHLKQPSQPCPYMAILVADGDRMGKFVASASKPEQHTGISTAVSAFADSAASIMQASCGHLVYAGGEDVMAFLPLNTCVTAAKTLADDFNVKIAKAIADLQLNLQGEPPPTLRVGIAIVHVLEPLGMSRQNADAAEKFAKGNAGSKEQGNALGLQLYIRAGHIIESRMKFNNESDFINLENWKNAFKNNHLTTRLAYELRDIADKAIGTQITSGYGDDFAHEEVKLLLKRASEASIRASARKSKAEEDANCATWKQLRNYIGTLPDNSLRDDSLDNPDHPFAKAMRELSSQLILARWLSASNKNETGEK